MASFAAASLFLLRLAAFLSSASLFSLGFPSSLGPGSAPLHSADSWSGFVHSVRQDSASPVNAPASRGAQSEERSGAQEDIVEMYERQAAEREEGGRADRQEPTVSGECEGQLRPYLDEGGRA